MIRETARSMGAGPFLVRGLAALAFAGAALFWRSLPLPALVLLFGVHAAADGALALATRLQAPRFAVLHALEGVVGIGVGVHCLRQSSAVATELPLLVGLWAFGVGLLRIGSLFSAILDRRETRADLWRACAGALSTAFAAGFVFLPSDGRLLFAILVGPYAAVLGGALLLMGVRVWRALRRYGRTDRAHPTSTASSAADRRASGCIGR